MISDRERIMAIVDNDCFTKSDVAILLEGDGFNRYHKAVELYKTGMVSKIVFSGDIEDKLYGSYPYDEIKPLLLDNGVNKDDIIHENKSTQTRQQAQEVIKLAKQNGWKKLALVASCDHQYRAYLTFLREVLIDNTGIVLYNTPARNLRWFDDEGWGERFDRLSQEFDRIEVYSQKGHLADYNEAIEYQKWKESLLEGK